MNRFINKQKTIPTNYLEKTFTTSFFQRDYRWLVSNGDCKAKSGKLADYL